MGCYDDASVQTEFKASSLIFLLGGCKKDSYVLSFMPYYRCSLLFFVFKFLIFLLKNALLPNTYMQSLENKTVAKCPLPGGLQIFCVSLSLQITNSESRSYSTRDCENSLFPPVCSAMLGDLQEDKRGGEWPGYLFVLGCCF